MTHRDDQGHAIETLSEEQGEEGKNANFEDNRGTNKILWDRFHIIVQLHLCKCILASYTDKICLSKRYTSFKFMQIGKYAQPTLLLRRDFQNVAFNVLQVLNI